MDGRNLTLAPWAKETRLEAAFTGREGCLTLRGSGTLASVPVRAASSRQLVRVSSCARHGSGRDSKLAERKAVWFDPGACPFTVQSCSSAGHGAVARESRV